MKFNYRNIFVAIIAAAIIAVPAGVVFAHNAGKVQKVESEKNHLQIDIQKKSTELDQLKIQTKQQQDQKKADDAEKERLKQQNDELQKQLQAKREKQANDAKLAAAQAASGVSGNCESYRPLVQKYFGSATPAAMIVMSHESGCDPNAVSPTNDHGLFQLNGMKIYDPEQNIAVAVGKYLSPRRGSRPNFSAWYAVCTPDLQPKYAGIWCS